MIVVSIALQLVLYKTILLQCAPLPGAAATRRANDFSMFMLTKLNSLSFAS